MRTLLLLLAVAALASCGPRNDYDARTNTSHYWPSRQDVENAANTPSATDSGSLSGPGNN